MLSKSSIEHPLDVVVAPPAEAAVMIVDEISALASAAEREGRSLVVGLATGRTPVAIYREWVRRARSDAAALRRIVAFNLDEYADLPPRHAHSCASYLHEHLGAPLGLEVERLRVPEVDDPDAYERAIAAAGGIDVQILGIGRNGHIGFNEPGSRLDSRTRLVELAATTREDAVASFGGLECVPQRGVTMGVATILGARRLRLFAFGAGKRAIVERLLREPAHAGLPASFVRNHADARLYVDAAALGREAA